jgi:hypothetical protein
MKKQIKILIFLLIFLNIYVDYWYSACNIKWNISFNTWEKIYHLPNCLDYNSTVINTYYWEKWFCSEEKAKKAWWRKSYNCPYEDNNLVIKSILYDVDKSCNIKYPWTIYRKIDNKCICENWQEFNEWLSKSDWNWCKKEVEKIIYNSTNSSDSKKSNKNGNSWIIWFIIIWGIIFFSIKSK